MVNLIRLACLVDKLHRFRVSLRYHFLRLANHSTLFSDERKQMTPIYQLASNYFFSANLWIFSNMDYYYSKKPVEQPLPVKVTSRASFYD